MKKLTRNPKLILLVLLVILGVAQLWSLAIVPEEETGLEANTHIRVSPVNDVLVYEIGEPINLRVENNSNYAIFFPLNFNVSMFVITDDFLFRPVNDLTSARFGEDIILQSNGQNSSYWIFTVLPDMVVHEPTKLVIGVRGNLLENGEITGDEVFAQTEITIIP